MGKVSLRSGKEEASRKVAETLEGTKVHQRQRELAIGRWDFVVFGPGADDKKAVLRVCVAEQMVIQDASLYMASIGDPSHVGKPGMISIEELAGGDIAEELRGLEVYHVSPLRPIAVMEKREGAAGVDRMRDLALEEFSSRNIAVIETPDESAWVISALGYLNECDEYFSDPFMSQVRSRMRDTSLSFGGRHGLMH